MPGASQVTPQATPAPPTSGVVRRCRCRQTLVDSVRRTRVHPYFICPFYGSQPLDAEQ